MSKHNPSAGTVRRATERWLETVVIGLNLCPFAKREVDRGSVRLEITETTGEEQLLQKLQSEILLLQEDAGAETTLLVHSNVLDDFFDYNQFLELVDALLTELGLDGEFQVASFHPQYQFAGTGADAAENFTNRSPYPMLHILREASVERAISGHPNIDAVPGENIRKTQELGADRMRDLLAACQTNQ